MLYIFAKYFFIKKGYIPIVEISGPDLSLTIYTTLCTVDYAAIVISVIAHIKNVSLDLIKISK